MAVGLIVHLLGMFAFLTRTLGNLKEFSMTFHLSLVWIQCGDKCKNIW